MLTYFNILNGLSVIIFFLSIVGLLYAFIKKKSKIPWLLSFLGSFLFILTTVFFINDILARITFPEDKIVETSTDVEGTVRLKENKYIVGEEIKEGLYDLTFQKDSGSFSLQNLYAQNDFRDSTSFGINKKFRLYLKEGDGLDIGLGIAVFSPATIEKLEYETVEISSGVWTIGETIASGTYRMGNIKYPGNLAVYDEVGAYKYSELLNEEVLLNLADGDILILSGSPIQLVPAN